MSFVEKDRLQVISISIGTLKKDIHLHNTFKKLKIFKNLNRLYNKSKVYLKDYERWKVSKIFFFR